MTTGRTEDFEAQRALLNDELTKIALTGGSTAKTREKLSALGEREQAAREAEQAVVAEQRKQREFDAIATAAELSAAALLRLTDAGYEVGPNDAERLAMIASDVVRYDPVIGEAEAARDEAYRAAALVSTRIQLLNDRASALQDLRLTGQSTPRDLAEAETVARDLETLQAAYSRADAEARAAKVPADMLAHRQRAMQVLQAAEKGIAEHILDQRIQDAENAVLDAVRARVAFAGVRSAVGLYRRSASFDAFVRFGAL